MANALQCKVAVQRDKYNVLQCLESENLKNIITRKYEEASVHVLPMGQLVHKVRYVKCNIDRGFVFKCTT